MALSTVSIDSSIRWQPGYEPSHSIIQKFLKPMSKWHLSRSLDINANDHDGQDSRQSWKLEWRKTKDSKKNLAEKNMPPLNSFLVKNR